MYCCRSSVASRAPRLYDSTQDDDDCVWVRAFDFHNNSYMVCSPLINIKEYMTRNNIESTPIHESTKDESNPVSQSVSQSVSQCIN
mmetsp:Transcript_11096/g.20767  ORF Transcript_11096/g.20767 Transcript_11096/m.20767 type:complete len:86 (+) Transcript_11096:5797-6054(+)